MTDPISRETAMLLTPGNQTAAEIVEPYPLLRPGAISGLLEVLRDVPLMLAEPMTLRECILPERGRREARYRGCMEISLLTPGASSLTAPENCWPEPVPAAMAVKVLRRCHDTLST